MLTQLIRDNAEERFLKTLEASGRRAVGPGVLYCAFGKTTLRIAPDTALSILKDALRDRQAEIYFFTDGDLIVTWHGDYRAISNALTSLLLTHYRTELETYDHATLFHYFDSQAQGEDLRLLMRTKIKHIPEEPQKHTRVTDIELEHVTLPTEKLEFSVEQARAFAQALTQRSSRKSPEILIVEDQAFSRKLLAGLFEKDYLCHSAKDAQEALHIYAESAPDIVFLDVELPGADGHMLAALLKKVDPRSYIIMVTGNHYAKDVEAAKANKVEGFIVKPYNKLKIMGAFEAFLKRKKP